LGNSLFRVIYMVTYEPNQMNTILVIEDDQVIRGTLAQFLASKGLRCIEAVDATHARLAWRQNAQNEGEIVAVLLDQRLPDIMGMALLSELQIELPFAPVIIMTAFGNVEDAVEAMRRGAFDYILKPFSVQELHAKLLKAIEVHRLKDQVSGLSQQLNQRLEKERAHASHTAMGKLYRELDKVSQAYNTTVLLTGETGTGKEVLSQYIHTSSGRRKHPFIAINCAALSSELLESELFGHEEGAFTGATKTKKGLFELANGGTLFLDEIGEMSLLLQSKLLRALEERKIRRVGSGKQIPIDVRLVAATNRNLLEEVEKGNFREDLYYRLAVITFHVPPLRQRIEEIENLLLYFIDHFNRELGTDVKAVAPEVFEYLKSYHWPGNIRQLKNMVERTLLLECSEVKELQLEHLRLEQLKGEASHAHVDKTISTQSSIKTSSDLSNDKPLPVEGEECFQKEHMKEDMKEHMMADRSKNLRHLPGAIPAIERIGLDISLAEIEREHIIGVLRRSQGNKSIASQVLGIDRSTLYNKIMRYQIGLEMEDSK
jgi:DNA-binding NtrC family response regulator